jgi:release factor glutamine methyltransferase
MQTIAEIIADAAQSLKPYSDSPRLDAELLLGKVLGLSRASLLSRHDESPSADKTSAFSQLIEQRRSGSPVAYILGEREFWSLKLRVTPAVLVPRPETELLVERALDGTRPDAPHTVLDLGTGSGAIALAIAAERPCWRVTAADVSPAALEVARRNAELLHCDNVEFKAGAWFAAVPSQRFDLIVSNPPYVASTDPRLAKLKAEPTLALSPGPTGLEALAAIIECAPAHLTAGGRLLLEHGNEQATAVGDLMRLNGYQGVQTYFDFSGKPRATQGIVHPQH